MSAQRVRLKPRLVNRRDADPGLLVELEGRGTHYLFDCGSIERLSKHEILRTSRIFVTHAHIDHWIGFDRFLRLSLGEPREIHVYGPAGLLGNMEGKFAGYLWNLQEAGPDFIGHEIEGSMMRTREFPGARQFRGGELRECPLPGSGRISSDRGVHVRFAALEHGTTTLGYCVETEPFHAVDPEALEALGLVPGTWLGELKEHATARRPPGRRMMACGRDFDADELASRLLKTLPADRVAYVTDTLYNERTEQAVAGLARDATVFFCEANFREEDAAKAESTRHLTARQAARFARAAGVAKLVLFHISRKYHGELAPSIEEARTVFENVE